VVGSMGWSNPWIDIHNDLLHHPTFSFHISDFATSLASSCSEVLLEYAKKGVTIEFKGPVDLVTEADYASEDFLVASIRKKYPEHGILTEERRSYNTDADKIWLVDPLDGTTNFAHRYPFSCISIAYQEKGELLVGVIYNIHTGECFNAISGSGARCNGLPIEVSGIKRLSESLVATGFPYDRTTSEDNNLDNFSKVMPKVQGIRRDGSAALDLCYVACGRLDAYWELKLKPWDMAAGTLIAREAGAMVTDDLGESFDIMGQSIVCSNGWVHEELLSLLTK